MKQQVHPQTFIVNQTMIIIMEHHALFMWNQYCETWGELGREHRERENEILRFGERMELAKEYSVGFISRTVILVWADSPKST